MRPFYVFDRWGKQVDSIAWPLSAVHKDAVNGEDSLTLTVIGDPLTKGQRIVWRDKFGNWHEHTVADTTTTHQDGQITETAYCENSISELLTDYLVEVEPRDASSQRALERALEGSRWVTGTVQPTGLKSFSWYHQDAYSAVTNIIEEYGAELSVTIEVTEDVVTARKVNILNHRGSDLGHLFTFGRNLAGIERTVETDSIYTALYGWGKGVEKYDEETGEPTGGFSRKISFKDINDGNAWVGDEEARLRYGVPDGKGGVKHAFGQVEFSDCEDAEELLELTKDALKDACKPKVSYTGTVISLAAGGYTNGEDSQPGDTVYLRDRELDERLQGRVLEVDRDLLEESNTQLTLSNLKSRYTQRLADDMANLDWLASQASKWDEAALLPDEYLDAVINRLNNLFNMTGGFCYFEKGEGLITYDKPLDQNPTMAIQITGAGFRIANSKNPDGSWNWRTFGTGDGFTADELITGIIKGGSNYWNLATGDLLFKQGAIRSADDVNFWNLSTGELQLGHGIIHDLKGNNSWNLDTGELSITSGTSVGNLPLSDYVNNLATEKAKSEVKGSIDQLVKDRLTQESIFNTLTNGGTVQGIYLKDGRVYINASYIATGTFQAGKIQDKNGYNFWDLETGELRISASAAKVGSGQTLQSYIEGVVGTRTNGYLKVDEFGDYLTQKAVFNALTNNGEERGLYLTGSTLYISADYIRTGVIEAQNDAATVNLNYGWFETRTPQVDSSGTYTKKLRINIGRLTLGLDSTDMGVMDLTYNSSSQAHLFSLSAKSSLLFTAPSSIYTGFGGINSGGTIYQNERDKTAQITAGFTKSGTSVMFLGRTLRIRNGFVSSLSDAFDAQSLTINANSGVLVASAQPAADIQSGEDIELVDLATKNDIDKAVADNRMIWQETGPGELGPILYTGEGWTCDPAELVDAPSNALSLPTPAYIDARTEVLQSEIEAIADSVTEALPSKNAKALAAKVQSVRAGIISGNEVKMAQIANDLSDTKPIFSVAQAKEVLDA